MSFILDYKKHLARLSRQEGFTLTEIMVTIGISGILILGIGQMLTTHMRDRQMFRERLDFVELKKIIALNASRTSTCRAMFGNNVGTNVAFTIADPNFTDPNQNTSTVNVLRLYDASRSSSGGIAALPVLIQPGGLPNDQYGSIRIQTITLEKVIARKVNATITNVQARLRFTTLPSSAMQAWTGPQAVVGVVGSGMGQFSDYVAVTLKVTGGTVVGCSSAAADVVTGLNNMSCPPGQMLTTDTTGTQAAGCNSY